METLINFYNKGLLTKAEMERLEKSQSINEIGLGEYEKTHSLCCDAKIIMGICANCKEHTVPQSEE